MIGIPPALDADRRLIGGPYLLSGAKVAFWEMAMNHDGGGAESSADRSPAGLGDFVLLMVVRSAG
jgi:hypothetical protein